MHLICMRLFQINLISMFCKNSLLNSKLQKCKAAAFLRRGQISFKAKLKIY